MNSLESLTDIGLNGGVDMRPTLIRVLTDLYVQRLTHSAQEQRHYTELALRLLETVDVPTRIAVAARLARHLSPPVQVMQRLAADLPEVASALRSHSLSAKPQTDAETAHGPNASLSSETILRIANDEHSTGRDSVATTSHSIDAALASELNELFFAASANERRLILLNLDVVTSTPAPRRGFVRDPALGQRLEAAVLGRKHEQFERELAGALLISREQARRIAHDQSGEPIVVAARALSITHEVVYRILLFVNTAVGHSVERVHALAELFDQMTAQAAQDLVAVWQALSVEGDHRATAAHRPLLADTQGARLGPTAQRRLRLCQNENAVRRPDTVTRAPAISR